MLIFSKIYYEQQKKRTEKLKLALNYLLIFLFYFLTKIFLVNLLFVYLLKKDVNSMFFPPHEEITYDDECQNLKQVFSIITIILSTTKEKKRMRVSRRILLLIACKNVSNLLSVFYKKDLAK